MTSESEFFSFEPYVFIMASCVAMDHIVTQTKTLRIFQEILFWNKSASTTLLASSLQLRRYYRLL